MKQETEATETGATETAATETAATEAEDLTETPRYLVPH